jgi:hypothetical protein
MEFLFYAPTNALGCFLQKLLWQTLIEERIGVQKGQIQLL